MHPISPSPAIPGAVVQDDNTNNSNTFDELCLTKLPTEILASIIRYTSFQDRCAISLSCRRLNEISNLNCIMSKHAKEFFASKYPEINDTNLSSSYSDTLKKFIHLKCHLQFNMVEKLDDSKLLKLIRSKKIIPPYTICNLEILRGSITEAIVLSDKTIVVRLDIPIVCRFLTFSRDNPKIKVKSNGIIEESLIKHEFESDEGIIKILNLPFKNSFLSVSKYRTVQFWRMENNIPNCFYTLNEHNYIEDALILNSQSLVLLTSTFQIKIYDIRYIEEDTTNPSINLISTYDLHHKTCEIGTILKNKFFTLSSDKQNISVFSVTNSECTMISFSESDKIIKSVIFIDENLFVTIHIDEIKKWIFNSLTGTMDTINYNIRHSCGFIKDRHDISLLPDKRLVFNDINADCYLVDINDIGNNSKKHVNEDICFSFTSDGGELYLLKSKC